MNKNTWIGIGIVLTLLIIGIGFVAMRKTSLPADIADTGNKTTKLCFYDESKPNVRGSYDSSWIKMDITDTQVTGEFRNLPAEKDSKVGTFTGTFEAPLEGQDLVIDAWWDSMAEGMRVTEQLTLKLGSKEISAGFSPMKDRGDGTYVYMDPANIQFWRKIPQVNCDYFTEKVDVKEYIREHIAEIVGEPATLGGQWYMVRTTIDPESNSAIVVYEDGHMQQTILVGYLIGVDGIKVTKIGDK